MRKIIAVVILLIGMTGFAVAQDLVVKGTGKSIYLDHTIAPKEGLYSIGRLYNVNPKHLAAFNKMDMNQGLNIGDIIKIPLSDTNLTHKGTAGVPVYTVTQGQRSVFGYLQSKELAAVKQQAPVKNEIENKPVVKEEPPKKEIAKIEKKPEVKEEPKPVVTEKKTEETKPVVVKKQESKPVAGNETTSPASEAGYFKSSFDQQLRGAPVSKNETVTSGIFKTTSGWADAKYYLLIDKVSPGTIVKVMNPDNNKVVYAKVLGEMNGIRQNQGLDIRISNAAASALGVEDPEKFIVKVNY